MFFEDIRSERLLMRHAADRLRVRWYVGYDLDEPLPDQGLTPPTLPAHLDEEPIDTLQWKRGSPFHLI